MPRGASYESNANLGNVPLSHNAIETGENKAVGTGTENAELNRTHKTAEMPEETGSTGLHSGQGTSGTSSGKGGHDPKTTGENKGLGAHKADGTGAGRKNIWNV